MSCCYFDRRALLSCTPTPGIFCSQFIAPSGVSLGFYSIPLLFLSCRCWGSCSSWKAMGYWWLTLRQQNNKGIFVQEQDDQEAFKKCLCDLITSFVQKHLEPSPMTFNSSYNLCDFVGCTWLFLKTRQDLGVMTHVWRSWTWSLVLPLVLFHIFSTETEAKLQSWALSRQSTGTPTFVGCSSGHQPCGEIPG